MAIVFGLVLSPFAAFLIWSQVEAARLNRVLDALEASREPLDVDKLDPRPSTDEQRQTSHLYAQAGKLVGETAGGRLTPSARTIEELCALPSGAPGRAERIAALRQIEATYAEVLTLLDRASALDAAGWDDADRPLRQSMAAMGPRSAGDHQSGPDRAARVHGRRGRCRVRTARHAPSAPRASAVVLRVAPSADLAQPAVHTDLDVAV